ncbi:hypothetical protein [Nocardiopsis sp. HUAS JQ3]|uniref:hypothetical protein n=1 Tax=Nocardiopsis sp. HUAS JQ3 TaxID=3061629 RepID=UPI0023A92804|nr:hypothetical protein [Nocardiopsis sp. HUAS JQ3]WDZ92200.1 hypothetical protein PV789_06590 [Nocardiopsis sp. HUAS JQ3]
MTEDVDSLIEHLELWRTHGSQPSHRDMAIAELRRRGPRVVPALIDRLQALLASSHHPHDHHGVPDRARYDRESLDLRQGLVQALARISDELAAAVLIAALDDDACVPYAAAALRQTPDDRAVGPLLDALARMLPNGAMVDDLIDTITVHGVSSERAQERWRTEHSPQGRANLMRLLARHGNVPVSVFLEAAQDRSTRCGGPRSRAWSVCGEPTATIPTRPGPRSCSSWRSTGRGPSAGGPSTPWSRWSGASGPNLTRIPTSPPAFSRLRFWRR